MKPKQPTFSISVVRCNGCTAYCHGPIMLHPGLGDDAANYETELTLESPPGGSLDRGSGERPKRKKPINSSGLAAGP
jgi:hypothetical protein